VTVGDPLQVIKARHVDGRPVRVEIGDGRITAITPIAEPRDADEPPLDWLCPGLIDLQVNGFAGHDVNAAEPGAGAITAATAALLRVGVTGWCPTVTTCSEPEALARVEAVVEAVRADPAVAAAVIGIHLEGPHLSPQEGARGVHDPALIRPPDLGELERLLAAGAGLIRIVTLAPEWDGADDYIRACRAAGIVAAIGHTAATPEQIDAAVAAGAQLSTHLGNGAAAQLPRHPNVVWSQLAADELSASFIADGHHLGPAVLQSMVRAKGVDRAILVSDSTAVAGQPPGRYQTPVGGTVVLDADGRLGFAGTPYLAGSAVSLSSCVARTVALARVTLADAVAMASTQPAALVGLGPRGRLAVGAPADLVRFGYAAGDRELDVHAVYVAGWQVA
jgi:N-acetylglucosamine-6-phosphate deacetylase